MADTIRVTEKGVIEFCNHANSFIAKVQWWDIERLQYWNVHGGRLYDPNRAVARDVHLPGAAPPLPANPQPHLLVTSRAIGGQHHARP